MASDDEAALLARCQKGDSAAYDAFFRTYRQYVWRCLHRILGAQRSDLDDALQEVFIEVFRSIARFRGDAKLTTWLYRVCVNVALQRLRKQRRLREAAPVDETEPSPHATPHATVESRQRMAAVYRLLDHLPPKKRMVFVLHEIEGFAPKEIARIVGAPVLTVRTRLHYARKEFFARAATDGAFAGEPIRRKAAAR